MASPRKWLVLEACPSLSWRLTGLGKAILGPSMCFVIDAESKRMKKLETKTVNMVSAIFGALLRL